MDNLELLNFLADKKCTACIRKGNIDGGYSMLLRYDPLIMSDWDYWGKHLNKCYVFEIGRNCGDVFSANLVERIELKDSVAIIHLK